MAASEASNTEAEAALARAADELENLRNRHHTAALAVANHEKDLERTRERVKALGEAQETRVVERSEILADVAGMTEERERLTQLVETSRRERGERQREQAIRLSVNIVLYALCLDYKDDQVHAPFIMRRRGNPL